VAPGQDFVEGWEVLVNTVMGYFNDAVHSMAMVLLIKTVVVERC